MKKRYHTNQLRNQFTLSGSFSNRSHIMRSKGVARGVSKNLAAGATQVEKLAVSSVEGIAPLAEWQKREEFEMRLEDEISINELNGFTFSCIESLTSFSGSGQTIQQVLTNLVVEKLTSFTDLAQEMQQAKAEFKEYVAWSKQFISSVQPILSASAGPSEEMSQLTNQVMQCAERSMGQKCRVGALRDRVDFLLGAVADFVGGAGVEMGLPKSVMDKVAVAVSRALKEVAS